MDGQAGKGGHKLLGRLLPAGDVVEYDVDAKPPGEAQQQLQVVGLMLPVEMVIEEVIEMVIEVVHTKTSSVDTSHPPSWDAPHPTTTMTTPC